eukprot:Hpha_TRINITY_DN15191_c4_g2::TRINITY_DN15191_c4_g2_i5::g.128417::m.128417
MASEDESVEESYDLVLEIPELEGTDADIGGLDCQLLGLNTGRPFLRIADRVYEGVVDDVLGTGLLLGPDGMEGGGMKAVGAVQRKLVFTRVFYEGKDAPKRRRVDAGPPPTQPPPKPTTTTAPPPPPAPPARPKPPAQAAKKPAA